jgi:hypothetical protein
MVKGIEKSKLFYRMVILTSQSDCIKKIIFITVLYILIALLRMNRDFVNWTIKT